MLALLAMQRNKSLAVILNRENNKKKIKLLHLSLSLCVLVSSTSRNHPLFLCSCFEDDEPPCVEEIEYSTYSCVLKGTDLDSDINTSTGSADEEEEGDEGHREAKHQQGSVRQVQQSSMKSCLFPDLIREASVETLSEKRNTCNGLSITNGQLTS